ncbi:hypothetical protein [Granulicatella sp. 19428wC4_WM01]|uniref:hypothetical protein n=1 Tax=unclassified Granulicatella TaxID=2630493 RepID=UPI001073234B|nr:hypothetical protein [Granulicatella sp. 19428wC4_WM01]TFU94573.1 hypothetical protein E4T68_06000 [Granulicatella sp. WM01]
MVIEAFNGDIFLNIADNIYATRCLLTHEEHSAVFDLGENIKKERHQYVPPQSHPWKLVSFKHCLKSIGKTREEYQDNTST